MTTATSNDTDAALATVWAKSPDATGAWLPLVQHLRDAARMAGWLWDEWLPPRTRAVVAEDLGLTVDEARCAAVYLAGVHDVGKATPVFAAMSPELFAANLSCGLGGEHSRRGDRSDHHSRTGYVAVLDDLAARGASRGVARTWAVVVGSHHGDPPSYAELRGLRPGPFSVMGGDRWKAVRDELLTEHLGSSGLGDVVARHGWPALPQTTQVLLTGLVIVADWMASNEKLFEYSLGDAQARLRTAVDALGLPGPWVPSGLPDDPCDLYRDRFGEHFRPRPVQRAVAEVATDCPAPPLMIVEAPMGEGKTEAALVAAEVLAARFGSGGIHLGLPTMATADQMFDRVVRWTESLPTTDLPVGASVWLGHGKSGLNDTWSELGRSGVRGVDQDGGPRTSPHSWMRGRKKAHLATVAVSTVDHLLFAGLRARHLMLRHLALAGKVVVVDEVHAYDAWMSGYLDRVLAWLGAYRVPVLLLSATLPPARRASLVEAYTGTTPPAGISDNAGYPLVTAATSTWHTQVEPARSARSSRVRVEIVGDDPEVAVGHVEQAVAAGGCVLVVRNTVPRAQHLYDTLTARLGADRVTLAHSRFLAADRAGIDQGLLGRFGSPERLERTGGTRPVGHVVVATQVAEQSLDVDFDLLLTDLAPVDLVLQRMGRLHRHDRPRPPALADPVCMVTGVEMEQDGPPTLDGGGRAVYREWALLRAAHVLSHRTHVDLPGDIADMVREAYEGTSVDPTWTDAMERAVHESDVERDRQERGSETFQIDPPHGDAPILGWIDGSASSDESAGSAHVRDSQDSLEVTVLVRGADGRLRLPSWPDLLRRGGAEVPTDRPIPDRMFRDLEGCTLRLPTTLSSARAEAALWDATPEAWEEGSVGRYRPLLALDEGTLTARLGEHVLTYDPTRGLTVAREETR